MIRIFVTLITHNQRFALFAKFFNYVLHNIVSLIKMIFERDYKNDLEKRKSENLNSELTSQNIMNLLIHGLIEKHLNNSYFPTIDLLYEQTQPKPSRRGCELCNEMIYSPKKNYRSRITCFKCRQTSCRDHSVNVHICFNCLG